MQRKSLNILIAVSMACVTVLAGCSKAPASTPASPSSPTSPTGSSSPQENITFSVTKSKLEEENKFYQTLVDDYNKMNKKAKVTLSLIDVAGDDTAHRTWVTTQLIGGNAPDIVRSRYLWTQQDYNKDLLVSFNQYLDKPTPYNDNKKWRDTFSKSILDYMTVPTTDVIAGIPTLSLAVRIYYNKKIFEAAGIKDIPQTWDDFLAMQQKILDKGKTPIAIGFNKQGGGRPNWMIRYLSDQTAESLVPSLDLDKNKSISSNEIVAGVDKGIIDFTKSPWAQDFEIMKSWTKYWPKGFGGMTDVEATDMFLRGDAAMTLALPSFMKEVEGVIDYGVMRVPYLSKKNHPSAEEKFYEVAAGNPDGVYALPKALTPVKAEAAVDFLQYMTSPGVQQKISQSLFVVPVLKDASFPDNIKNFLIVNEPFKMNLFGPAFSVKLYDTWGSDGPLYLSGSITLQQFTEKMNAAAKSEAEALKKSQNWSEANNYGITK
jgi:raffinose/stachyose/melibiose transport system substrate-binding protein